MKRFLFLLIICSVSRLAGAQNNTYGLIRYKIPINWSEQTKTRFITYTGNDPETNLWMEIRVHEPEGASVKPDSSFKLAWKNHITAYSGMEAPASKKGYTRSGLPMVYNVAFPAIVNENNVLLYKELITVIIDKQMQVIEMIAASEKDLKMLRNFMEDFADGIDSIAKRKE